CTHGWQAPGSSVFLRHDEVGRIRAGFDESAGEIEYGAVVGESRPGICEGPEGVYILGGIDARVGDVGMLARGGRSGQRPWCGNAREGNSDRSVVRGGADLEG